MKLRALQLGFVALMAGVAATAFGGAGNARPLTGPTIKYHLMWTKQLGNNADSTTIVKSNVTIKKRHFTVAYVLTGNNGDDCNPSNPVHHATTFAFVVSTGRKLWTQSTSGQGRCTTAAPAVSGSWVYSSGLDGRIHKYKAATGSESHKDGWPKLFTRQPYVEKSSSALRINGDYLYVTTSGFDGDAGHYEGHVVTINLKSGHENVWNSLCSNIHVLITDNSGSSSYCGDVQAGMFGRGQASIDPLNQDIYVVTGNGPWNGKTDWGDSVLKLNPAGTKLLDAFTPTDQQYLNNNDLDLGSTGSAILPPVTAGGKVWHLLVQGGKGPATSSGGNVAIWLVNRDQMGPSAGPGHTGMGLDHISSPGGSQVLTAPAVWVNSQGQPIVIYGNDSGVTAYDIKTSGSKPQLGVAWSFGGRSTSPVTAGGILYIAHDGEVDAYDPSTGHQIWSSTDSGVGGTIGSIHWEYPSVSGKWLFMTDENGKLYAYES